MQTKHNDASENTMFVSQELESVKSEMYTEYPNAKYSSIVPVDSSDDEGAEEVGYLQYDSIGASAIVADGTTDSPAVDAMVKKVLLPVHEIGNHWSWTQREVRNGRLAGRSLDKTRANVAMVSTEQHHDDICMLADGTNDKRYGGMNGIVFHPNVSKMASPKTFALATNAEILGYFADMIKKIVDDTLEIFRPDTFALSDSVIAELRGRVVDGTNVTLWSQIKDTYADFSFITHYKLNDVKKNPTTGAEEATRVIICYKKTPTVLRYKMPMGFRTYPAVSEGRSFRIETASTSAGVEVRQPLAVLIFHSF